MLAPEFWKVPLATAWFFTSLTLIAFVMYYLYKDMSYCKYICPIGTLTKVYAKVSFAALGTYKEDCSSCKTLDCAVACPYNLNPFSFDNKNSMDDCTLCMDCSSACDSVAFRFTKPSAPLFEKFKYNKAEVWALILITAAISITMNFPSCFGPFCYCRYFYLVKNSRVCKTVYRFWTLWMQ